MIHKSPIVAQRQDIQAKIDVQAITVNLYVLLLEGNFFRIFCMRLIASSIALVSKAAMATCSYTSHTAKSAHFYCFLSPSTCSVEGQ